MDKLPDPVTYAIPAFILLLIANLIISWVMIFARDWQPRGVVLLIVEGVFAVTEPPLKLLRRFIPPLRLGGVAVRVDKGEAITINHVLDS